MNDDRASRQASSKPTRVSVVLPVFNEAAILERLYQEVNAAIRAAAADHEFIFVDDGSRDDSSAILDRLATGDANVRVLHLSRNFGHQAALQAGLSHASGDVVVVMDSDLQDDPSAIGRFLEKWREGYDVVFAIRTGRKENALKRFLFFAFYRILNAISRVPMPADAGNFGLLDRRVAREVAALLDHDRYFAGLRSWVGFRQVGIEVERGSRYDDHPRVSLIGLARLAKSALFSFSSFPLTVFYLIGLLALGVFAGLAAFTLYHKLFTGLAIPGWTSMTMATSFFGALNALGIAVLGEYVTRIYEQVRLRPLFVVERRVNFPESSVGQDPWADDSVATAH